MSKIDNVIKISYDVRKICYGIMLGTLLNYTVDLLKDPNINYEFYNPNIIETVYEGDIPDFTVDYIKDMIYSSPHLNDDEKRLLYNEQFFSKMIPVINKSDTLKIKYLRKLKDIKINYYDKIYYDSNKIVVEGFYNPTIPNELNVIKSSEKVESNITHEFMHLCSSDNNFMFIEEIMAEIINVEYYGAVKNNIYSLAFPKFKLLANFVGEDKLWEYFFTGDKNILLNEIEPYLEENEYEYFVSSISFIERNDIYVNINKIDHLIYLMYKRKYNMSYYEYIDYSVNLSSFDYNIYVSNDETNKSLQR